MKSTEHFKRTIEAYLIDRAYADELFAVSFNKPNKNMDDCITYILNCVKQSGCNGFTDEEIYSMAMHYYDEENIETGNPVNCSVVVNHTVELTPEEKEEARQKAIRQVQDEAYERMTRARQKVKPKQEYVEQKSLFDL